MATHNVFHQLRSVTSNSFDGLEYVNLTVLNHLLDAGIGSAIDSTTRLAIAVKVDEFYFVALF